MPITKQAILEASDLERIEVAVPEWNMSVYVRTMTGAERDEFVGECQARASGETNAAKVNMKGMMISLLIKTLCDEAGKSLFGPEDAAALSGKSGIVIERLFLAAQKLNRIGERAVEDAGKN